MRIVLRAIALTLILTGLVTAVCYADTSGAANKTIPAVTVNIPVEHIITGDAGKCDKEFTFVLTAEKEDSPMPVGSQGKSKSVNVKGKGNPEFGSITFTYPDAYYYSVSCGKTKYRVMIAMYNNGTSQIVAWDSGGSKAEKIVFSDEYEAPAAAKSPKTGDSPDAMIYPFILIASGLMLGIFLVKRKADDNDEEG
ncbi:MAG: hypothetical protein IKE85_10125 [Mogibacterium sp.]|nr:hypothetical protein [Mogibacterium sp.]MBR2541160.1 hypothetical protein [Mogibacterium sp.]